MIQNKIFQHENDDIYVAKEYQIFTVHYAHIFSHIRLLFLHHGSADL